MNTAHRYWLFEGSTLFKIVDSEACERMENCWKLPEVV